MNIVIAGGGTGGHLYPGLELAKHFRDQGDTVIYVASSNGIDQKIVDEEEKLDRIKFFYWDLNGFDRSITFNSLKKNIKNISKLKALEKESKKILVENKIDLAIGVGGYISYPLVSKAQKLGIKTLIHEQNSYPGMVNKMLAKKATYLTGAYENASKYFGREVINVSNPRVDNALQYLNKKFYKELDLNANKKIILFLGGSLGANTINNLFTKFIENTDSNKYQVVLVSGLKNNHVDQIELRDHKVIQSTNKLLKYISTSDIVISRGGATTLLEIMYLEKKSIIIPSPNVVANHQYYNALEFYKKGMLYMIEEKDLNEELFIQEFKQLEVDTKVQNCLQKYDKILSVNSIEKLVRR